MKDKLYYVIDKNAETADYVIEVPGDEDLVILRRSKGEMWSNNVKGEEILRVYDSGSGYRIVWAEKPDKKVMEYHKALELSLILNFMNKVQRIPLTYHIVEVTDTISL